MNYFDMQMWRVWPDGTCQENTEPLYAHMGDDFALVRAETEEDAFQYAKAGVLYE